MVAFTRIILRKLFQALATSSLNDSITRVSLILRVNGTVISNSISKAELPNQHFESVFTIEENNNLPDKEISSYPAISNIEITVPGVYNLLSNCNPHKSQGPDNVHNYVLKETADWKKAL